MGESQPVGDDLPPIPEDHIQIAGVTGYNAEFVNDEGIVVKAVVVRLMDDEGDSTEPFLFSIDGVFRFVLALLGCLHVTSAEMEDAIRHPLIEGKVE